MTNIEILKEKFPNFAKDEDGLPLVCPGQLGLKADDSCDIGNFPCRECWNMESEVEE